MMSEKWTKWKPIKGLAPNYYIDSVIDTIDGFKIELSPSRDKNQKVLVLFSNSVDSYRSVDESFVGNILYQLSEQYGKDFFHKWTFFKVTDSYFLKWLSQQSDGISEYRPLMHFSFIAIDSIVDVICDYEPKVELL
jgi:hypothetical protein